MNVNIEEMFVSDLYWKSLSSFVLKSLSNMSRIVMLAIRKQKILPLRKDDVVRTVKV